MKNRSVNISDQPVYSVGPLVNKTFSEHTMVRVALTLTKPINVDGLTPIDLDDSVVWCCVLRLALHKLLCKFDG